MANHELRMYILINNSVKMSTGKVVAQAGHGVSEMTEILIQRQPQKWKLYKSHNQPKISLKCPEVVLKSLLDQYGNSRANNDIFCVSVIDAGRTQIEPGTLTAIVFSPMSKACAPKEFDNLKLY